MVIAKKIHFAANMNIAVKKKIVFFLSLFLVVCNLLLLTQVAAEKVVPIKHITSSLVQNYSPANASYPNKRIVISLSQQALVAYDSDAVFLQTPITSGGPDTPTPLGTYYVLQKLQSFVMHSPWPSSDWRWYPDSYVHYGLLFKKDGYFIHDALWRDNFGPGSNAILGIPGGSFTGSHGCINMPYNPEAALFNWATVGTAVVIGP